jgi:hypothetical protein
VTGCSSGAGIPVVAALANDLRDWFSIYLLAKKKMEKAFFRQ